MANFEPNFHESLILFADLQKGIADGPVTVSLDRLGAGVAAVAKLATLRDVPVIVSTVPSQEGEVQLIDALQNNLGDHQRFLRMRCDSGQEPQILDAIKASGRKKIIISGVAIEIAVSLAAYSLQELGYQVFVVVDACAGTSQRTEAAVLQTLVSKGILLTSVASLAGIFAGEFSDPKAMDAIGILYASAQG